MYALSWQIFKSFTDHCIFFSFIESGNVERVKYQNLSVEANRKYQ